VFGVSTCTVAVKWCGTSGELCPKVRSPVRRPGEPGSALLIPPELEGMVETTFRRGGEQDTERVEAFAGVLKLYAMT